MIHKSRNELSGSEKISEVSVQHEPGELAIHYNVVAELLVVCGLWAHIMDSNDSKTEKNGNPYLTIFLMHVGLLSHRFRIL